MADVWPLVRSGDVAGCTNAADAAAGVGVIRRLSPPPDDGLALLAEAAALEAPEREQGPTRWDAREQGPTQGRRGEAPLTPREAVFCRSLASRCDRCGMRQGYILGMSGFGWRQRTHDQRCSRRNLRGRRAPPRAVADLPRPSVPRESTGILWASALSRGDDGTEAAKGQPGKALAEDQETPWASARASAARASSARDSSALAAALPSASGARGSDALAGAAAAAAAEQAERAEQAEQAEQAPQPRALSVSAPRNSWPLPAARSAGVERPPWAAGEEGAGCLTSVGERSVEVVELPASSSAGVDARPWDALPSVGAGHSGRTVQPLADSSLTTSEGGHDGQALAGAASNHGPVTPLGSSVGQGSALAASSGGATTPAAPAASAALAPGGSEARQLRTARAALSAADAGSDASVVWKERVSGVFGWLTRRAPAPLVAPLAAAAPELPAAAAVAATARPSAELAEGAEATQEPTETESAAVPWALQPSVGTWLLRQPRPCDEAVVDGLATVWTYVSALGGKPTTELEAIIAQVSAEARCKLLGALESVPPSAVVGEGSASGASSALGQTTASQAAAQAAEDGGGRSPGRGARYLSAPCRHCGSRPGFMLGLRGFGWHEASHEARCARRQAARQRRSDCGDVANGPDGPRGDASAVPLATPAAEAAVAPAAELAAASTSEAILPAAEPVTQAALEEPLLETPTAVVAALLEPLVKSFTDQFIDSMAHAASMSTTSRSVSQCDRESGAELPVHLQLTDEEEQEARLLFELCDVDGSDTITLHEFAAACVKHERVAVFVGLRLGSEDVARLRALRISEQAAKGSRDAAGSGDGAGTGDKGKRKRGRRREASPISSAPAPAAPPSAARKLSSDNLFEEMGDGGREIEWEEFKVFVAQRRAQGGFGRAAAPSGSLPRLPLLRPEDKVDLIFDMCDVNQNGSINLTELAAFCVKHPKVAETVGLKALQVSPTRSRRNFDELFADMDADGSRDVSLDEFRTFVAKWSARQ